MENANENINVNNSCIVTQEHNSRSFTANLPRISLRSMQANGVHFSFHFSHWSNSMKYFFLSLFLMCNFSFVVAQDSISWGPVIQLSPDTSGMEHHNPQMTTTGNTLHCIWNMGGPGAMKLPYIRSIDDGISFEEPRDLGVDTTVLRTPHAWATILSYNGVICIPFITSSAVHFHYPLFTTFSFDEGNSWSNPSPTSPIDDTYGILAGAMYKDTIAILSNRLLAPEYSPFNFARSTNLGASWSWTQESSAVHNASVALSPGTLHYASNDENILPYEISYRQIGRAHV